MSHELLSRLKASNLNTRLISLYSACMITQLRFLHLPALFSSSSPSLQPAELNEKTIRMCGREDEKALCGVSSHSSLHCTNRNSFVDTPGCAHKHLFRIAQQVSTAQGLVYPDICLESNLKCK